MAYRDAQDNPMLILKRRQHSLLGDYLSLVKNAVCSMQTKMGKELMNVGKAEIFWIVQEYHTQQKL